jgi:glycosyltransferase involved in cell wall biosynthesis
LREGFRTRDGHLIIELAKHPQVERVIVVDRPVSMAERSLRRLPACVPGTRLFRYGGVGHAAYATEVADKTLVIDICVPDVVQPLLMKRGWWFDIYRRPKTLTLIESCLRRLDARQPAVVAWTPTVAPLIDYIDPRRLVFDSLDNWLIHPVLRAHAGEASRAYASILPRADSVIVAAPASRRVLERWRSDIDIVPNGVDKAHFLTPGRRPADLPASPVVGYAGKLARRIDTELILEVAAAMPDVQFAFVGPVLQRESIRQLRGVKNIRLLGDRHYSEIPSYIAHFDVAWIPHRVGEGETGGDPIKLYEYWACGRPVVATQIDGLEQWRGKLELIRGPREAVAALRRQLVAPLIGTVPPDREWASIAARIVRELDA